MKDAFMSPVLQALLCLMCAAALYVLAGKQAAGDVHDGLVALAGVAATLWARLPQKGKDGVPPSAAAPLLVMALAFGTSGCASRQAQMNVVEVATTAANEFGQGMLALYQYQVQHCVEDSATEMAYTICKMGVDQAWDKARVAYGALRRVQDEYATALERGDLKATDYLEWFRTSYCELKAAAPPELVLPPIPSLTCGDSQ